jgi:hypothetical protein
MLIRKEYVSKIFVRYDAAYMLIYFGRVLSKFSVKHIYILLEFRAYGGSFKKQNVFAS